MKYIDVLRNSYWTPTIDNLDLYPIHRWMTISLGVKISKLLSKSTRMPKGFRLTSACHCCLCLPRMLEVRRNLRLLSRWVWGSVAKKGENGDLYNVHFLNQWIDQGTFFIFLAYKHLSEGISTYTSSFSVALTYIFFYSKLITKKELISAKQALFSI